MRTHLRFAILSFILIATPTMTFADQKVELFNGKDLEGWTKRGGNGTFKVEDGEIVGHIAFSPVTIETAAIETATIDANSSASATAPTGLGLAPLAVMPKWQRLGIGASLGHAGMDACRRLRAPFVVVLGSPIYYARFGFSAAARWKLLDEYQGGPAFQAIELIAGAIPAAGGLVRYAPEFAIFAP